MSKKNSVHQQDINKFPIDTIIKEFRNRIINRSLFITIIIASVVLVFRAINRDSNIMNLSMGIDGILVIILIMVFLFRNRIRLNIRAVFILSALFIIAISEFFISTRVAFTALLFVTCAVFATLMFNRWYGVIVVLFSIITVIFILIGGANNWFITENDLHLLADSPNVWFGLLAGILLAGSISIMAAGEVNKFLSQSTVALIDYSEDLIKTNELLQKEIKNRQTVEDNLGESETKFKTLFTLSPEPNLLIDNGVFIDCNPATISMLGGNISNVINKKPHEISPPVQPDGTPSIIKAARLLEIAGKKGLLRFEWLHRRIDGTLIMVDVMLTKISLNGKTMFYTSWRDITDKKRAEKALQLSEEKFRKSIQHLPTSFTLVDENGKIIEWNPAMEKLTGYSRRYTIGKTYWDIQYELMLPEMKNQKNYHRMRGIFQNILKNGITEEMNTMEELQILTKDGQRKILQANGFFIKTPSGFQIGSTLVDITEQKRAERRLLELNKNLRMLSRCNFSLVRAQDQETLVKDIVHIIIEEGDYSLAWMGKYEDKNHSEIKTQVFKIKEDVEFDVEQFDCISKPMECPPIKKLVETQQTVIVKDMINDSLCRECIIKNQSCNFASLIVFPIKFEEEIYGALMIVSSSQDNFAEHKLSVLEEMVDDLSFGIHTLQIRSERLDALSQVEQSQHNLEEAYDATLEGWSRALELRERETAGHSERVIDLTLKLAKEMNIPEDEMNDLRRGALLHDIGKMGIPDQILLKPGKLNEEEWELMRQHPLFSSQLLENISYLQSALDIPRYHHERWDGTGYPYGLKGTEIPLSARIFSVVDVWDAMTSDRPYSKARSPEETLQTIIDGAGTQFDAEVVEKFKKIIEIKLINQPRQENRN